VSTSSPLARDRRKLSRIPAQLACMFTHGGVTRPATILDLSLGGAFLESGFLPPKGSVITISLESPLAKKPVILAGTVVRGTWGMSGQGDVSRFGVHFSGGVPGLLGLLRALIPQGGDRASSDPPPCQ
jgi:hypothetical protein